MADHHETQIEIGAPMDYKQHEKTYARFLTWTKYATLHVIAIIIAMIVGIMMDGGLFGGILTFLILSAASFMLF